ncbi:MAG: hypothetical protein M1323_01160 [Candidatus Thermoplasmatota archaeon]|nr:hypothetical protein [Candidatus Thermoplasmatota archaeon]
MDFGDIDRVLDRRMVLTMKQDNEIFQASREVNARIPVTISDEQGKKFLFINFPGSFGEPQKNRIFLKKYDAKNIGTHYVIKSRINHVDKWKYINDLINVPSVVVNRINLKDGLLAFYFRYHHSVKNRISCILSKYTDGEEGQIETIGPTPGLISIMDRMHEVFTLGMIQISIPVNDHRNFNEKFLKEGYISESSNNIHSGHGLSAIIYTGSAVDDNTLNVIDSKSGIYSVNFEDPMLTEWRNRMMDIPVIRFRQFMRIVDNELKVITMLPYSQIDQAYRSFFQTMEKTGNEDISLDFSLKYNREIMLSF